MDRVTDKVMGKAMDKTNNKVKASNSKEVNNSLMIRTKKCRIIMFTTILMTTSKKDTAGARAVVKVVILTQKMTKSQMMVIQATLIHIRSIHITRRSIQSSLR